MKTIFALIMASTIASPSNVIIVTSAGDIQSTGMVVGDTILTNDLLVQVPESTRSVFLGIKNAELSETFHQLIGFSAAQKVNIFPFGVRVIRDPSKTYIELPSQLAIRLKRYVLHTLIFSGPSFHVSLDATCGDVAPQMAVVTRPLSVPDIFRHHATQASSATFTSEGIIAYVSPFRIPAHRGVTLVVKSAVVDLCNL